MSVVALVFDDGFRLSPLPERDKISRARLLQNKPTACAEDRSQLACAPCKSQRMIVNQRNTRHAKRHTRGSKAPSPSYTQLRPSLHPIEGYESPTRSRAQRESPVHRNAEWHIQSRWRKRLVSDLTIGGARRDVCGAPIGRGDSLPVRCCRGIGVGALQARRSARSVEKECAGDLYI